MIKYITKKIFTILVLIILIVNSVFATSVNENDGSAFITKAEFDALKSSFQSKIDEYNLGIDSKIDSAVASYLSGIKITNDPIDYYAKVKSAYGNSDPIFLNSIKTTKSSNKAEIGINVVNRYYIPTNVFPDTDYELWYTNPTGTGTYTSRRACRVVPNATRYDGTNQAYNFMEADELDLPLTSIVLGQQAWVSTTRTDIGTNIWTNATYNPENKLKGNTTKEISDNGEGTAYITHVTPAGNVVLREYASSIWPLMKGTVYFHMYADYYAKSLANWKTYHNKDNGMPLKTAQTLAMPTYSAWGTVSEGTSRTDESTTQGCWGDLSVRLYKVTDGVDYSSFLWGRTSGMAPYCIHNTVSPSTVAASYTLASAKYETSYYDNSLTKQIQKNDIPSNKVTYYKPSITPMSIFLKDIISDTLTSLMGENVKLGSGIPIFQGTSDEKVRIKIKFGTSGGSYVNFSISDKMFVDGNNVGTNIKTINNATSGTEYIYDIDSKNNTIYWLNVYNTTTGATAYVDSFSVEKVETI